MVQCEMCGTETASPNRVKIEGAELNVCDECTDFGTEVKTDSGTSSTSTKYSTSSSSGSSGSSSTSSNTGGSSDGGSRRDMYDEMDEIAPDYDERIRNARESSGLTQEELAKQLNEKASLIRKLEHGETLPSDEIRSKLERGLDIALTTSSGSDDTDWSSDQSSGGYTLGDVVERKD
ncbi:multiprotein bridging factor aMBF1 [Halovenus rubra]|uniref:Multiprotein bridging factor aMBF1 n=2 Tax=Halovenus rubra TaxID=869890 RepID=A0ACC7DX01_9EURY|nr:multiprotein bridging factor aMBF1 [Halovenus rubra]